jgi:hypothetical protein
MCMLDVFDRAVVAYHIGLSCEAKDLVQITQEALMKRQLFENENKPVVRSDNGPQFISHLFEETCEEFGVMIVTNFINNYNQQRMLVLYYLFLAIQYFRRNANKLRLELIVGIRYAMISVMLSFAAGIWISANQICCAKPRLALEDTKV